MLHPTTKNGRRLPLTLGGECPGECRAHGCRLGADGRGDLARHGRPAWRAALARSGGRTLGAGKYEAIPFVGAQLLGVAVCGARHSVRAAYHRVHAPCPQPSVKVWLHAPIIGRMQESLRLTAPSASAAARWWNHASGHHAGRGGPVLGRSRRFGHGNRGALPVSKHPRNPPGAHRLAGAQLRVRHPRCRAPRGRADGALARPAGRRRGIVGQFEIMARSGVAAKLQCRPRRPSSTPSVDGTPDLKAVRGLAAHHRP